MKAMEYVGFRFIRGCGCRGGICGACSTVFRREGDYRLYTGLACQTVVEPGMYLTQIPFYPALRKAYEFEELQAEPESIFEHYPEIFRCVACNACTKVCPMDVEVMDYVSALKRGDIERAAEISFDCIQCGLCASRCMGELPQYHIAQMARRLSGGKLKPKAEHLAEVVAKIADGKFDEMLDALKSKSPEELRDIYSNREMEPAMSGDDWQPDSDTGL
jgi:succinate dehydrogenase/fumarate reductase-like Fe-S protein